MLEIFWFRPWCVTVNSYGVLQPLYSCCFPGAHVKQLLIPGTSWASAWTMSLWSQHWDKLSDLRGSLFSLLPLDQGHNWGLSHLAAGESKHQIFLNFNCKEIAWCQLCNFLLCENKQQCSRFLEFEKQKKLLSIRLTLPTNNLIEEGTQMCLREQKSDVYKGPWAPRSLKSSVEQQRIFFLKLWANYITRLYFNSMGFRKSPRTLEKKSAHFSNTWR